MKIAEILKNPILVVFLGVSYFFALQLYMPRTHADKEVRAAYNELQAISRELAESKEPGNVKAVIQNFSGQIIQGFKAGFKSDNSGLIKFNEAKQSVVLSDIKRARSSWKTTERFVGKITNNYRLPITQIKLNFASFSKDGRLIDVNNTWLSDIKILNPKESAYFEIRRNLGQNGATDAEIKASESARYEIRVSGFEVKDLNKVDDVSSK